MVGAQLGVLIISLGMKPLIDILGNVNPLPDNWKELPNAGELKAVFNAQTQNGYFYTMLIFGTVIALTVLGTALYSKDRERTEAVDWPTTKSNLLTMVKCKPWWMILFSGFLTILAYTTRFGAIVYFIKYYFQTEAVNSWGGQGAIIGIFFTSGTLCALAGSAAYGFIAKKFDKKIVFMILVVISGVVSVAFSLIPPDSIGMFITIQIVFSFLMGPTGPIIFSMYTDVADFLKSKSGEDTEGLAMAVGSFCNKFGWTVGPTLSLLVLSIVGYDPDAKVVNPDVVNGLSLMLGWGPAMACFGALVFMWFYPLNNVRMDEITKTLEEHEKGSVQKA
jgi:glycoside/pentoside/hexuronide:cation symporter, GPH family